MWVKNFGLKNAIKFNPKKRLKTNYKWRHNAIYKRLWLKRLKNFPMLYTYKKSKSLSF